MRRMDFRTARHKDESYRAVRRLTTAKQTEIQASSISCKKLITAVFLHDAPAEESFEQVVPVLLRKSCVESEST